MSWIDKLQIPILIMNAIVAIGYLLEFSQPGKILYWSGVTILTVGLILMRG